MLFFALSLAKGNIYYVATSEGVVMNRVHGCALWNGYFTAFIGRPGWIKRVGVIF